VSESKGAPLKLLTQPGDGADALLKGIAKAKKSVEIVIFRFDRSDVEQALMEAVERGVFVHALIAFTNRGGEEHLRKLETRFLEKGISVARTASDLVRYHGKMILIDRRDLYLLSFNFTHLDIDHSRSFGLITRNPGLVREASKLFEADSKRQPYVAGSAKFVVSPVNAREVLSAFIKGAKKELLIYDPEISDRMMLRIVEERGKAGVEVRVIGKVSRGRLQARGLANLRLHTRTIIRDRCDLFLGSQSLRPLELDSRREIGVILRNRSVVNALSRTFEQDWAASQSDRDSTSRHLPVGKTARKVAKELSRNLALSPVVKQVVKAIQNRRDLELHPEEVEETVKSAVKEAVKDSLKEATKGAIKNLVKTADLDEIATS